MIQTIFVKRQPPVGSRPGTLVIKAESPAPRVRVIRYNENSLDDMDVEDLSDLPALLREDAVTWVDVQGLGDEAKLRAIGEAFGVHALGLEDIVNVPQRPKAQAYENHIVLISRMARIDAGRKLDVEQLGLVLGSNYIVSFQERYGDVLDPVRERIRAARGPIRGSGADYLAYVLMDTIVDAYYPVLEDMSDWIEELGEAVMEHPTPKVLRSLYQVRADLLLLRRGIWPQRETLNKLLRDPDRFFSDDVRLYLRDTHDHSAQLVDVLESHREIVNGALNLYLSVVANRTNEVMKVLTIMASIFIPLTFMAGIYGMNFENMPELRSRWAYPALLTAMSLTAGGMLAFFWRKGWLGGSGEDSEK